MKRRNIVFSLTLIILIITIITINRSGYFSKPSLTVHLRCDKEVSGTLQANIILPTGVLGKTRSFDVKKVCGNGELEFDGYQREEMVKFTFKYSPGKKAQITSKYGSDIQSDQNGYYMALKIINRVPFIANDRI